jgi:hypothetical protein
VGDKSFESVREVGDIYIRKREGRGDKTIERKGGGKGASRRTQSKEKEQAESKRRASGEQAESKLKASEKAN